MTEPEKPSEASKTKTLSPRASVVLRNAFNKLDGFPVNHIPTPEEVRAHFPSYGKLRFISGCGKQIAFEICKYADIEAPPTCPHCGQFMP